MSDPKICDYCGEYQHDCKCAAARKIAELQRERDEANDLIVHNDLKRVKQLSETRSDRDHFKQLAEEWEKMATLLAASCEHIGFVSVQDGDVIRRAAVSMAHFHSLQQQKKDEKV